jgi:hypothetical protein
MASTTTFLGLTLPELNEFVDSWNQPINANFEEIDEYLSDLYDALGTNAALKGSAANLAARLDVSINPDGTLDVSGSSDILAIATSAVRGQFSDPRSRLDDGDFEVYDARQPVADGRFVPMAATGPSDGYPPEQLDAGIALRTADFAGDSSHPICSPRIPWAPGLVTGGAVPFISAQDIGVVRMSADAIPAIFNIDGYIFRIREIIDFDWNALSPSDNDYVWIYVERLGTGYNDANFKYDGVGGGGVAAKDLRKLQSGTNGNTSGSTFTDTVTPAQFDTIPLGKVKEGDVLVIETGAAAGSYVIDALDGTTPDTKLTIKGTFKANLSGLTWHILDNAHPNIGAEVTDSAPTTQPSFEPGRVYIGRAKHRAASNPEDVVVFRRGGVYDSTWIAADAATIAGAPVSLTHNLGQLPTHVEVWFRTGATGRAYQPLVERQVVTKMASTNFPDPVAGDTSTAVKMLFPSVRWHASNTDLTIMLANQTLDPAKGPSLFTDSGGSEVTSGQMRVIARL